MMVWREGTADWTTAGETSELAAQLVRPPTVQEAMAGALAVSAGKARPFAGARPEPHGIHGWLVLVAFGQIIGPLQLVVALGRYYSNPDHRKVFGELPLAMFGELALNVAFLVLVVWTAVQFYRQSRHFPRMFILEWIAVILLPLINTVWVALTASFHTGTPIGEFLTIERQEGIQIIAAMILGSIWIAYTLKSQRVRNTFVE
jgi:hypothetical protein